MCGEEIFRERCSIGNIWKMKIVGERVVGEDDKIKI